jgi:uroporphyrinogen-III synthase
MSRSLHGIRIAHFEARRAAELNGLISRHGGVPWSAPALSEVPITPGERENAVIDELVSDAFDLVVLLTGVGTRRLFDEAVRAKRLSGVITGLQRATIIARGPKPVPVLREHGLRANRIAPEPHTTIELVATLDTEPVGGRRVLVLTAGEPFEQPSASLRARGAEVVELQLYKWALSPSDASRIEETINEIVRGRMDAVLFTSQVQIRHLLDIATQHAVRDALLSALRGHVLVGAVGPTVEQVLAQHGLHADVVPEHPKMGHLVVALADRVAPPKPGDAVFTTSFTQLPTVVLPQL